MVSTQAFSTTNRGPGLPLYLTVLLWELQPINIENFLHSRIDTDFDQGEHQWPFGTSLGHYPVAHAIYTPSILRNAVLVDGKIRRADIDRDLLTVDAFEV